MKKASSDPPQATVSHDIEAPPDSLPFEVPGLNVAALYGGATTLKGDDPELFPPELPVKATLKRENEHNDYKAKYPYAHGRSKGIDDGLELSYPPILSPDSPAQSTVPNTTSITKAVAASRQPGAEHVSGILQMSLPFYDVDGNADLPRESQGESMHHLTATLVEASTIAAVQPAAMAEVISDSELKAAYQRSDSELESVNRTRNCKLLWTGGLIIVAIVVTITVAIILTQNPPKPVPTAAPALTAPSVPPTFNAIILETLNASLPDSSQTAIAIPDTPQYQALEWLSGNDNVGVETFPDYRIIQRYALATLYYATNGVGWKNGWLTPDNECNWFPEKLICNNGILTTLDLGTNNLNGVLPPDIGMLSNLTALYLYQNTLTGRIPSSLGLLTSLVHLGLDGNELTGTITPSLGQLTSLAVIFLYSNTLNGTIPSSLGQLTRLDYLNFGDNILTGTIPSSLGQVTNMKYLGLHQNGLDGEIPATLSQLTSLEWVELYDNSLTGTILPEFCALVNLTNITVDCDMVTCGACEKCTCA